MAETTDAPKTAPVSSDAPAPETTAKAAATTTAPAAPAATPATRGRRAPRKAAASPETKARVARSTIAAAKARSARPAAAGTKAPRKAAASPETKARAARATAAGTRRANVAVLPQAAAKETTFTGFTAVPRSIGLAAAEYVEEGTERYAAFQEALADNARVEWLAKVVRVYAKATRDLGQATARGARSLLEA